MKYLKFALGFVAVSLMLLPLMAQGQELQSIPDVKILFGMNSDEVSVSFGENAETVEVLDNLLLDSEQSRKIKYIKVISSSSIDGNYDLNKRLAQKRIEAVRAFLVDRYASVPQSIFVYSAVGENWDDLRACVVADAGVPHRSRVLAVIDNSSGYDEKELEFKNIAQGESWDYMKNNIFPQQRFGVGMIFELKEEYMMSKEEEDVVVEEAAEPEVEEESEGASVVPVKGVIYADSKSEKSDNKFLLALKTNLLSDLATAVNFELEVPIGTRYSVSAEFMFPWWRCVDSDFTMQILSGHFEGKYWFGERTEANRLLGFSAGIFAGFGTYDIQPFTKSGVTGDFFEAGIIGGYSHSIWRNLNLEYEIGIAYIHSDYRRYDMGTVDGLGYVKVLRDECSYNKLYKNTCLPSRLKVSLVWKFAL